MGGSILKITNEQVKNMYETMLKIRKFETRAKDLFAEGKVGGFVHLYIGEEAVATGACANLKDDDYITSTHRGHGHIIAKGGDLKHMMAELYQKETGYCKGKGGSMHIADATKGILGANGIVGAGHNIAAGAGLAIQYKKTDQVCVCFFGDASTNQSTFHEALNLASVWKLPVIFVCENNGYGISVSQARHQAITDVSVRASAYNMPGVTVDGNDVFAVHEAVGEAVSRARKGQGPTLIECKTYRWRGHFEGDPTVYRPEGELDMWIKKDPIPKIEKYMVENSIMTKEEIDQKNEDVDKMINEAEKFADESSMPSLKSALEDVYTDIVEEGRIR
ncbi:MULTISPECIES: thiamine pyrophosphate-dependent dehydrogenase E1 component subunit alpha [unclassified Sedimentibacter]|uniref:thiamine pyrophosphate-dependent dehydrogenase E1 component subunit alpha n=1 Tax=unclassified Sedimentibacter TaxID=2649220 RepID=UPI0027E16C26|nr:thiamine pyrophosphate-dependent dehydrogenase E1 component subunit alpha [Sedimentibacter sp. MB35-C1]WMJ78818.1 thiamine pyrophosphate-dependent dehydrogenase E1 component subunit alpha [Sedimentibacter sp. MB35-C1]